jgi:hypothetical protein
MADKLAAGHRADYSCCPSEEARYREGTLVSQVIDENERNGQEVLMASVTEAITSTVEQLKREYQVDHALYVAGRYVTYLQDQK